MVRLLLFLSPHKLIPAKRDTYFMKVYSFYNPPSHDFEPVVHKSETIPDQSLSVRDILLRFTRGSMPIPSIDSGEDDDIDRPDDISDMIEAQDQVLYGRQLLDEMRLTQNDNAVVDQNKTETDPSVQDSTE